MGEEHRVRVRANLALPQCERQHYGRKSIQEQAYPTIFHRGSAGFGLLAERLSRQSHDSLKGIVVDLLDEWLPRAYRLTHAGAIGANPDQRIHEDARHLAELCADLGIGLFQSSLLLGAFIGVLWEAV